METLCGRKIVGIEIPKGMEDKSCLILTLDDGSTLTVTEGSGPGWDANLYTYPVITWQKDGKTLNEWRL